MNLTGWAAAIFYSIALAAACVLAMTGKESGATLAAMVIGGIFGSVSGQPAPRMRQADIEVINQARQIVTQGASQPPSTVVIARSDPTVPIGRPVADPSPVKRP